VILLLLAAQLGSYTSGGLVSGCHAPNGESIRCIDIYTHRTTHIRLNGIEAPTHYCNQNRWSYTRCGRRAVENSQRSLNRYVHGQTLHYTPLSRENMREVIAKVISNGRDLSCTQVTNGSAEYSRVRDIGKDLYRTCSYVRRNYRWNGERAHDRRDDRRDERRDDRRDEHYDDNGPR